MEGQEEELEHLDDMIVGEEVENVTDEDIGENECHLCAATECPATECPSDRVPCD